MDVPFDVEVTQRGALPLRVLSLSFNVLLIKVCLLSVSLFDVCVVADFQKKTVRPISSPQRSVEEFYISLL